MSSPALAVSRTTVADYLELTKPRITLMVGLTTLVGFVMASQGPVDLLRLLAALTGTGLVAAGASTLNMLVERDTDALMARTRTRPLPSGRLRPIEVLMFGAALTAAGLVVLVWLAGHAAAWVALLTWGTYLLLYTPLKRRTSLAILVGAVPGALPPVIGWSSARGLLDPGAYVLFAILFLWQIPHFLSIAWIYREDYARGGLPMLPVLDPAGRLTGRQVVANTLALLVVSLAPAATGMAGRFYGIGAFGLGLGLTAAALAAAAAPSITAARRLFVASIIYLPCLCALLLAGRQ